MNQKINLVYGSINPFIYEHGRAFQIYSRLNNKQNVDIFWIDPPLVSKNIGEFLNQFITRNTCIIYEGVNAINPIGIPGQLSNEFSALISTYILKLFTRRMNLKCDILIVSSPAFLKYAISLKKENIPLIYDCRDVFSKWEHVKKYAIEAEKELICIADVIITSSEGIKNEVLKINNTANVIAIPNGVPQSMVNKFPKKTKNLKPKVGFVGHMGYYVDLSLVLEIAKEMKNVDFILVGDHTNIKDIVENAPKNCVFMGEVPFESLNDLYCTFDIGIIPFKANGLTNPIIPIKLIEYFAKGLPVVCSPLDEVKRIDKDNLIHYADGKEDWINKIEIALEDDRQNQFIEFANGYTWENATERYISIIEGLVEQSQEQN